MVLLITAIVVGGILAWLACGALAYALTFAYFQRAFPAIAEDNYQQDRTFSLKMGAAGPIGLLVALLHVGENYRLKWR